MAKNPPPPPANSGDNDLNLIFYFFISLLGIYAFALILGFISVWVYAPITALPYYAGIKFEKPIFISLILLLYAAIFIAIDFLWTKYQYKGAQVPKERSYGLRFGAGFLIILAVLGVVLKWDVMTHPLLSHIHTICSPTSLLSPYSGCSRTFMDVMTSNPVITLSSLFVPNLIILICCLPELFRAIVLLMDHPDHKVTKKMNVEDIIQVLSHSFAHLKFYKKFNPAKFDFKKGPFAVLMQSREFADRHGLITGFKKRQSNKEILRTLNSKQKVSEGSDKELVISDSIIPTIDEKKFELLCLEQLGETWPGVDALPPHTVIVLSILFTQCTALDEGVTEEAYKNIIKTVQDDINNVWSFLADYSRADADGDLKSVPKLIKYKHYISLKNRLKDNLKNSAAVANIINKHAYTSTIIYAASITAKEVGVLSPNSFRWLKYYDRTLYASLQNARRPSVFAEDMGGYAHYSMEAKIGKALYRPDFQAAYNGLNERLSMFAYNQDKKSD